MKAAHIAERLGVIERELRDRPVAVPDRPVKAGDVIADIPNVLSDLGLSVLEDLRRAADEEDTRLQLRGSELTDAERRLLDRLMEWIGDSEVGDSFAHWKAEFREQAAEMLRNARTL